MNEVWKHESVNCKPTSSADFSIFFSVLVFLFDSDFASVLGGLCESLWAGGVSTVSSSFLLRDMIPYVLFRGRQA